jgi:hypothetical protein
MQRRLSYHLNKACAKTGGVEKQAKGFFGRPFDLLNRVSAMK